MEVWRALAQFYCAIFSLQFMSRIFFVWETAQPPNTLLTGRPTPLYLPLGIHLEKIPSFSYPGILQGLNMIEINYNNNFFHFHSWSKQANRNNSNLQQQRLFVL